MIHGMIGTVGGEGIAVGFPTVIPLRQYAYNENHYRSLVASDEQRAQMLLEQAQKDVEERWKLYQQMANQG
jgi:pyruvate-ferredoxin/flavodoxin oxidoreductase